MTAKPRAAAQWARDWALVALLAAALLAGCSSNRTYEAAFSSKTALADNSRMYQASAGRVFDALKLALVQQGFEIEQADSAQGLLKGMRTFDDPRNPKIAYLVSLTADVAASSTDTAMLTAAASQKTVLNREIHKYYHLLGLLPIPTGREYQSVVRAEGNITGGSFYQDLFAAVARNLKREEGARTAALTAAKPAPLQSMSSKAPSAPAAASAAHPR